MKKLVYLVVIAGLALAGANYFHHAATQSQSLLVESASAAPLNVGCGFPTKPAATPEETAWQLFIAANCPAADGKLAWETWEEQLQVYPAGGKTGAGMEEAPPSRLHGSPLALAEQRRLHPEIQLAPSTECGDMNAPPPTPPMAAHKICEEVHLNPEAKTFVYSNKYRTRPGQTLAAQNNVDIEFPRMAVEVKVDWIPATDFQPAFTCDNPPQGVHVEMIQGTCYAMAGMHISSKLLKDWLWATFEPQSMTTNPLRCITFGACTDRFGSKPATSAGGASGFTQVTEKLAGMIKQAGLATEFLNYRLDGVQTKFTTANGNPTYLANSIIEGENVGMAKNTASCITCHSVSSIENNGTDGITKLANQVGPQYQIPPGWIARDFVWSMALACPGGIQTCKN